MRPFDEVMATFLPAFSLTAAVVGLLFALLSFALAAAPGWAHLRWFGAIALSAGLFCLFDSATTLGLSAKSVTWASQITLALAGLHGIGWLCYGAAQRARSLTTLERSLCSVAGIFSVLALVPGLLISHTVTRHTWAQVAYDDASPTTLGALCYLYYYVALGVPLLAYVRGWQRGEPGAAVHALALGALVLAAVNDGFVSAGLLDAPYLLELAFLGVVLAVGAAVSQRFIAGARALDELSGKLERTVEARTRELTETQLALHRAEKLAAIGQLAAGVAHEINNPAGAVVANLGYLSDHLIGRRELPDDTQQCLEESQSAMQRIARITRQLLDAGRVAAGAPPLSRTVDVARAIRAAVATARASMPSHVMVSVDAPVGLHAVGDTHQLEQVVVNLTVNAAQSIPATRRGHVVIRATHEAEHVLVEVADDGVGIPDELQHRIFEPFFTTKALGEGTGLGLAVSMGLVRSLGGSLRLLESSSSGTRMGVNLRWSPAGPSNDAVAAVVSHTAPKKLRLLLVDDEPAVRAALRRVLATRFSVETADGVTSALELVRTRDFDVVVCDVMMPDGGGGRLHEELARWRPDLAARTVFVTGASVEHAARELQVDRRRILTKPLDVDALCSLLDERALIRDEVTALSA